MAVAVQVTASHDIAETHLGVVRCAARHGLREDLSSSRSRARSDRRTMYPTDTRPSVGIHDTADREIPVPVAVEVTGSERTPELRTGRRRRGCWQVRATSSVDRHGGEPPRRAIEDVDGPDDVMGRSGPFAHDAVVRHADREVGIAIAIEVARGEGRSEVGRVVPVSASPPSAIPRTPGLSWDHSWSPAAVSPLRRAVQDVDDSGIRLRTEVLDGTPMARSA